MGWRRAVVYRGISAALLPARGREERGSRHPGVGPGLAPKVEEEEEEEVRTHHQSVPTSQIDLLFALFSSLGTNEHQCRIVGTGRRKSDKIGASISKEEISRKKSEQQQLSSSLTPQKNYACRGRSL